MNQQAPQSPNMSGLFPGASGGLQNIMQQLQSSQNAANVANQQRYKDILGMYSNLGKSGEARIAEKETQAQAANTQNLTSRGLGNTTVTSSTNRGIASDAEFSRQALGEQVAQLQGGVMERATQQGPNLSMYANLIQQAMAGQTAGRQRTISGGQGGTYNASDVYRSLSGGSSGYGGSQANNVAQFFPAGSFGSPLGQQLANTPSQQYDDYDWSDE
jgi:hypothetical protein